MYHKFLMALLLVAATLSGSGMVAAQEQTPTTTANSTTSREAETVMFQIDEFVTLRSASYDAANQTFTLTLHNNNLVPRSVVIVDSTAQARAMDSDEKGIRAHEAPSKRLTINEGVTTVTMHASPHKGVALLAIGTTRGNIGLSSGSLDTGGAGPFAGTSSTAGWIGGATVTVSMVALAAIRIKNREYDDVEDVS